MLLLSTIIYVLTGLLMSVLAIPLWRRRVKPNAWYGLRVASTFADERVWYDANEASGRDLFLLGAVTAIASLALWLVPAIDGTGHMIALTAIIVVGSGIYAWVGITRANRLLAELKSTTSPEEAT